MKKILLLLVVGLSMFLFSAKLDKSHSEVNFTIKHLLITDVNGYFQDFDFDVDFDNNYKIKSVKSEVKVNTVDTRNGDRDEHLRSPDFFDVAKYPEIKFESTAYRGSETKGKLEGYLTIRDKRKKITLDVQRSPVVDFRNKKIISISLNGDINRKDFDVGAGVPNLVVSDDLKINAILEYALD